MQATSHVPAQRKLMIYAWRLLITLTILALVLYTGISLLAANVVTTPRRISVATTPAQVGLAFEDVRFPARSADATIAGWYIPTEGATRGVVMVHGKDSSRSSTFSGRFVEVAAALHAKGFAVLMIDLRGHGDSSPARFSFGLQERRDIIGAVDWLESVHGIAAKRIGVLGVSMGAAAGIGAMHDDADIAALVADCSYAEVYPLMEMHWAEASHLPNLFLPGALLAGRLLTGEDLVQSRPVADIVGLKPVLIIHGTADSFTPIEQGRQLAAANPNAEYWEVAGADHARAYAANPQAYLDRVIGFFDQAMP